jgi:hypothetical protein
MLLPLSEFFGIYGKRIDTGITYGGIGNPAVEEAILQGSKALGRGITGLLGFTDSHWAGSKDSGKSIAIPIQDHACIIQ